jgi:hypothetical protein
MKTNSTRFPELGFVNQARGLWRFVDMSTGAVIGPCYARKDELLADLTRFATEFGCAS